MKFSYTSMLNNYCGSESPNIQSRRVWQRRRSVKVFTSTQHHQDTFRYYESMLRGMYSFNEKVADTELFPPLPDPLVPYCENPTKHISNKQPRGAQAVRRKRTLVSRSFKIGSEAIQQIDSSRSFEFGAVRAQEFHREPGNSQLRSDNAIQMSSIPCQREEKGRDKDCFEESDWVDIEDEDLVESLTAEAETDEEYVWL